MFNLFSQSLVMSKLMSQHWNNKIITLNHKIFYEVCILFFEFIFKKKKNEIKMPNFKNFGLNSIEEQNPT